MLTRFADWSSVLGALLGAAGLIYSIRAFLAAKGAKQSAEEARRDVRSLVAADKFNRRSSVVVNDRSTRKPDLPR